MFVEKILHSICGILNIDGNTRCISRVYVYIDIYVYIYMHIYIYAYIYMYIYMHIYVHIYIYTCTVCTM